MKTAAGGIFESIRAMNADTTAGTTVRFLAASTSDPFNNANGGKVFIDAIRTATNMDLAFSLNDVAGAAPVERVRFMGNGNVGIGITTPLQKLQVDGVVGSPASVGVTQSGIFRISNTTDNAVLDFGITIAGSGAWIQSTDETSLAANYPLLLNPNGGNVGIGTLVPADKLHVIGNIRINGGDILNWGGQAFIQTIGANDMFFRPNSTLRMILTAVGNLGLGVLAPATLLSVGGAGSTSAASGITFGADSQANLYRISSSRIKTDGNFTIDGQGGGATSLVLNRSSTSSENGMTFNTAGVPDWYFYVNDATSNLQIQRSSEIDTAPRVRFDGSNSNILFNLGGGNVGIGTAQPTGKLHVVSSIAGETVLRADGTNGTLFSVVDDLSDSLMSVNNSAGLPVLEVFADDRVVAGQYGSGDFVLINNKIGVGTSNPANKLSVIGAATIGSNSYNVSAPANGLIVEGSVGIGTTSPDTILTLEKDIATTAEFGSHGHFSVRGKTNTSKRLDLGFNTSTDVGFIQAMINGTSYNNLLLNANGGNVGIGLTTPAAILNVKTSTTANREVFMGDSTAVVGVFRARLDDNSLSFISLENRDTLAAINHGVGIRFNLGTNASNNAINAGGIYLGKEQTWTATASTQDSYLIFNTSLDGTAVEKVRITSDGNVGIGTTNPSAKLTIVENTNGGTINLVGRTSDDTAAINFRANGDASTYAYVSPDTNEFRLYHNDGFMSFYPGGSEKVRITSAGNVGIGLTVPTDKIQISGGGISFTTSTGLAVPMIGIVLPTNVAYIGPYSTTTDGNAPSLVLFNHGASVQQTYFYSSGRIAMVLNKEGRLNIAGNAGNTPPALLNVGPTSSVTAVSGMSFANDASANLYRSAASTIKTDGSLIVAGNVTATNLVSGNGTANFITKWNDTKSIANSQIFDDGTYVGINTAVNTTYRLQVIGSFAATTKSFDITHPTVSGKRLAHASLEGPENGVYYRGRNNNSEIKLPHYWSGLVHDDSITVDLTSIGKRKDGKVRDYSVDQIGDNKVYIYTDSDDNIYNYYYTIFAERKDVSKLVTERYTE
jgi:hypothetical protein